MYNSSIFLSISLTGQLVLKVSIVLYDARALLNPIGKMGSLTLARLCLVIPCLKAEWHRISNSSMAKSKQTLQRRSPSDVVSHSQIHC